MAEASEGGEAAQQAREGIEAAEQRLPQRMTTRIAIIRHGRIAVRPARRAGGSRRDAKMAVVTTRPLPA
jgi:hypothetical protein